MRLIGRNVSNEIFKLVPLLDDYTFFKDGRLESYVLDYLRYKVGKTPLRAYTAWKFFEYLDYFHSKTTELNKDGLFSQKLPLVFEIIISIQYLHNHILDEKYDAKVNNRPKLWQNLISSNLLKELLFSYLKTEINPLLQEQQQNTLREGISKIFNQVDIGQRLDKEFTTYKRWKEGTMPDFDQTKWLEDDICRNLIRPFIEKIKGRLKKGHKFTDVYFHRIYLTNVYFFRAMAELMISFFPEVDENIKKGLIRFSILQGYVVQIINDYADFAYSEEEDYGTIGKKTTDLFADLYNFNITLPLIIHLQTPNRRKIEAYLEGGQRAKKLLQQYPLQIMQEIIDTRGTGKCIALSRDIAEAANNHLDHQNPISAYLVNITNMANGNRFYSIFKMANIMNDLTITTSRLLQYILQATGINIPMTMNTEYDPEINGFQEGYYLNGQFKIIPKSSNAIKIVSEQKRKEIDTSFGRESLSSYFSQINKKKSILLKQEEAILVNNGINISKGYYIPYCIPPGEIALEKFIFLIFKNEKNAEIVEDFLIENPFVEEEK